MGNFDQHSEFRYFAAPGMSMQRRGHGTQRGRGARSGDLCPSRPAPCKFLRYETVLTAQEKLAFSVCPWFPRSAW